MGFVENLPRLPKQSASGVGKSPFALAGSLTPLQAAFFFSGWASWMCDAIDFFAVSLTVSRLTVAFGQTTSAITTSITLTLLFRPVGAIIFGLASDRFGRKWPLVVNLLLVSVLSLGTGCTQTFQQFLAVRSLFGIGMGGIWGQSTALALENMPSDARGLFSGILQQGYAVGYLIAAVINLTAVANTENWRVIFYIAAGISLAAALLRIALPESTYFADRQAEQIAAGSTVSSGQKSATFIREAGKAMKLHWRRAIFAILLMTWFNFFSHGSQDLYPTYINVGKGLGARNATLATITGNCGAVAGGVVAGYVSQYLGRRLTMMAACVWTLCFLPLWYLPTTFGPLAAGAFFVQFGVQGAWGVIPIYLTEISPVAFRSVFPGVAYQVGNMISSAAAQIEATAGQSIKTSNGLPDYGKVSIILIGIVAGLICIFCLFGPEELGAHFENGKAAFEVGSGLDEDIVHEGAADMEKATTHSSHDEEKGIKSQQESV